MAVLLGVKLTRQIWEVVTSGPRRKSSCLTEMVSRVQVPDDTCERDNEKIKTSVHMSLDF